MTDQELISQYISKESVYTKQIVGDYINGLHLGNNSKIQTGVVIVFGGSEGSYDPITAAFLANAGYEVLALYYFGAFNQNKTLNRIPIDFFSEALNYIYENCTSKKPITIVGSSKGAELALTLAEVYSEINHLILFAPSSYRFQNLDFENPGSSWMFKNEELPYISFWKASRNVIQELMNGMNTGQPIAYESIYKSSIMNSDNQEQAKFDVNKMSANILIFAGGDDKMWPSKEMSEELKIQDPEKTEVIVFENAGHAFGAKPIESNIVLGGTVGANQEALKKSMAYMLQQLARWHSVID
jgi:esterase/lipase